MRIDQPQKPSPASRWGLAVVFGLCLLSVVFGLETLFYCTAPLLGLWLLATIANALLADWRNRRR